jgi:2-keto-4-pentenoate hydratase/2-oxohepta-3-ene-1,7-dioic acid hydratase in catechol pathway
MRFAVFSNGEREGLAVTGSNGEFRGLLSGEEQYPGPLDALVRHGRAALNASALVLECGPVVDLDQVTFLPPLPAPGKIICVGLNYVDHSLESGFTPQDYPTIFSRFASSLVAAGAPIICPRASTQLDYECEMVAVIGAGGWHIPEESALNHMIGYSIFNDASIRDFQKKAPQWTMGKNFDDTGAFGPYLVTADELPFWRKGTSYTDPFQRSCSSRLLDQRHGVRHCKAYLNPERDHDPVARRHHRERYACRRANGAQPTAIYEAWRCLRNRN